MDSVFDVKRGFEKISINQWAKDAPHLYDQDDFQWDVKLPFRATKSCAGYDIFASHDCVLTPNQDIRMPLGWKVYMMENEVFQIYPRSSLGFKYYVRLANTVGIIDSDYYDNVDNEGHCWIKLRNEGSKTLSIAKGDAIAQGIFTNFLLADGDDFRFGQVRSGGIGSTNSSK